MKTAIQKFNFLVRRFPNSKFIHIIRNPYSNLVSLIRYKGKKSYPTLEKIVSTLVQSHYYMYRNERLISNYKIIKYEDLVSDTEETMKSIALFLNIEYNENLVIPTVNGKKWEGNSVTKERFDGVSDKRLNSWKNQIRDWEIQVINNNLEHVLKRFSYPKLIPGKMVYYKHPTESIRKYIVNRIYVRRSNSLFQKFRNNK